MNQLCIKLNSLIAVSSLLRVLFRSSFTGYIHVSFSGPPMNQLCHPAGSLMTAVIKTLHMVTIIFIRMCFLFIENYISIRTEDHSSATNKINL